MLVRLYLQGMHADGIRTATDGIVSRLLAAKLSCLFWILSSQYFVWFCVWFCVDNFLLFNIYKHTYIYLYLTVPTGRRSVTQFFVRFPSRKPVTRCVHPCQVHVSCVYGCGGWSITPPFMSCCGHAGGTPHGTEKYRPLRVSFFVPTVLHA